MKEHNTLESLFEELRGSFDTQQPPEGHRERFRSRLSRQGGGGSPETGKRSWWRPLAVAASVVLFMTASVFLLKPKPSMAQQVAAISPEVSETSMHFTSLVALQVRELQAAESPETQPLIDDTLRQLQSLEADYKKLEQDLVNGGNTNLILSAMITNFQTRIDLLEDVRKQIEQIKQFKNNSDENIL